MGDLFWNKVFGVVIGGVLVVIVISQLGGMLVGSHDSLALDEEHVAYPVDWDALGGTGGQDVEEVIEGPTDYGVLLASADLNAGERVARRCASCHTFNEGGATGTGPNLWNTVNRPVASVAGFGYSAALQGLGGDWTYEALDGFLESPRNYANGTAMSFAGLRNEADRINLIAYMRSLSNNPAPLPAPLAAAIDAVEDTAGETAAQVEDAAEALGDASETLTESTDANAIENVVDDLQDTVEDAVETDGDQ